VSSKGKGHTDETLRQSQLIAEGNLAISAVDGLTIDVRQVDQQTVSQSIDAMVQADPQLAWLKEAEQRGDVDWRQVKEIHDSFNYSHSGLGPASQIIIAIVMAAVVGPAAMGAMTGATSAALTAGTLSASTAAGLSAAAGAVAAGAATNASVSAINHRGDLGAVFKDVTSSDAMKGYVISGITAGLTASTFDKWTGAKTNPVTGKVEIALDTWKGVGQFAAHQTLQSGTSMALSKALGQRGSAGDALKSALFNTLAAASFNAVGDYTQGLWDDGSAQKIAVHAMVGGLLAEATGGAGKAKSRKPCRISCASMGLKVYVKRPGGARACNSWHCYTAAVGAELSCTSPRCGGGSGRHVVARMGRMLGLICKGLQAGVMEDSRREAASPRNEACGLAFEFSGKGTTLLGHQAP
jgi:filamentous hemagglutinin